MNKLFALLIAVLMIFSACANNETPVSNTETPVSNTETNSESTAESTSLPDLTSDDITESSQAPEIKSGYIDFKAEYHHAIGHYEKCEKTAVIAKNSQELTEIYSQHGFAVLDAYDESYFNENAVAFVFLPNGASSDSFAMKNAFVDESGVMTATVSAFYPEVSTEDMVSRVFSLELKQTDVANVTEINAVFEYQESCSYYFDEEIPESIPFDHHLFGGNIQTEIGYSAKGGATALSCLEIANNHYEFSQIAKRYTYNGNGDNLTDFAESIDESYFADKMLVAVSYKSEYNNTTVELMVSQITDNNLRLDFLIDDTKSTEYSHSENVIVIAVPKGDFTKTPTFITKTKYIEYDYTQVLGDIPFTPYIFKGCPNTSHDNTALEDPQYALPTHVIINTKQLAYFVEEICEERPPEDGFHKLLEGFDDEFFKENALVVSSIHVDSGEKVEISKVDRYNHLGFGVLRICVDIYDSVKPSNEESAESYIVMAVIDKNETIGYDWSSCYFNLK